jgi:hypothetical protein
MCRKPFGSGGKRVAGARPKRPLATSSATISRMKSRRGDDGGEGEADSIRSDTALAEGVRLL